MIKILHRFFYAWIFLTRFPAPPLPKAKNEDWGRIAPYFSVIGFVIGFVLFLFTKVFLYLKLPILFSALLLVFMWVLITGGLHMDGVMDTFDGVNCTDPSRKIEAMKDSRVGAFGAMAGIFLVFFKVVALCTILTNKLLFLIVISPLLARLMVVYSFTFLSRNKDAGVSSSLLLEGIKKPNDFFINVLTLIFFLIVCRAGLILPLHSYIVIFILIAFFTCLLWAYWLNNHFKGHTGDTFGALIELSEVTILSLGVILKNYL